MSRTEKHRLALSTVLLCFAGLVLLLQVVGCGDSGGSDEAEPSPAVAESQSSPKALACTDADEPANFDVFNLGSEPVGLAHQDSLRRCDTPGPGDAMVANYVSYIYGDCDPPSPEETEYSCQSPLEIQTWPACQRSKADYVIDGRPAPAKRLDPIEEAAVYSFEQGRRLEVYSGDSTIVVVATRPEIARASLAELRQQDPEASVSELSDEAEPGSGLTAPSPGAMEGELRCDA